MTRFHVQMTVICPSNWDQSDVRAWIDKFLVNEERLSVEISPDAIVVCGKDAGFNRRCPLPAGHQGDCVLARI